MIIAFVLGSGWSSQCVHATNKGSRTTLCGEPVGRTAGEWPAPGRESSKLDEATVCVFCRRLVDYG